ncbi:MAG: hypothetical protein HeimC2_14390 [Candidatus Heimdallarchaeota archaeon LC_2]|nr:MAG: hypothetical protein HeimC2_14390 [Candidatus Heimdallarchaeota archaeon LC_2]
MRHGCFEEIFSPLKPVGKLIFNFSPPVTNNAVSPLQKQRLNSWKLVNGHDLTKLLHIGLKYIFRVDDQDLTHECTETALRKSFEIEDLKSASLYTFMSNWGKYSKYVIF